MAAKARGEFPAGDREDDDVFRPQRFDRDDLRLEGDAVRGFILVDVLRPEAEKELAPACRPVRLDLFPGERKTPERRCHHLVPVKTVFERRIEQVHRGRGEELGDEGIDRIGIDIQRLADLHQMPRRA